jgi:hypothetical protein
MKVELIAGRVGAWPDPPKRHQAKDGLEKDGLEKDEQRRERWA